MDGDTRREFTRIEGKLDNVSAEVHEIKVKQGQYDVKIASGERALSLVAETIADNKKAMETLNDTVNILVGQMQGEEKTKGWIWKLIGTLLLASLIGAASTIIDLKERIAVLEYNGSNNGN